MDGLQVYSRAGADPDAFSDDEVIYSRRADGPYYRWRYDLRSGQWRGARVTRGAVRLNEFRVLRWSALPLALQTRLDEHYLE